MAGLEPRCIKGLGRSIRSGLDPQHWHSIYMEMWR
jgi:hypothetical protein